MVILIPVIIVICGLLSGILLFRRKTIPVIYESRKQRSGKISVIIPARNEEKNLPILLESLKRQLLQPDEIIVVDDHSIDRTKEIAESYGVIVLQATDLPEGWTGKNWAIWNGYQQSTGDVLIFLDADIHLEKEALLSLINEQILQGGVISIVPYHQMKKLYEKLAMIFNLLGAFVFISRFEQYNKRKGLYGPCIITTREDYETIGGHESIKAEMLDDLNLGVVFQKAGIRVSNYLGVKLISFRMYPNGLKSQWEGFSKGAVQGTSVVSKLTLIPIIFWFLGIILSTSFFLFIHTTWFLPLVIGYVLYVIQIYFINQSIGNFGIILPFFPIISMVYFLLAYLYSAYQSIVRKKVIWKGRYVSVGRSKR
ncbi:glycosyltransferase [Caldibacillus lycopersici]|uniref:4,4'-diaponeurosporenoate glycosyltransferase n=1 Tax=Perspicuibacillus lycopersici TaxID=1325689 RepID=A0AAE3LNJ3_9BACI|nr:glycosyltransferase family 2 protein [Perspicuibacillus lycopersici]MCU9614785.1 glycosyltransferase [Perspicuibacillus lycopersici]